MLEPNNFMKCPPGSSESSAGEPRGHFLPGHPGERFILWYGSRITLPGEPGYWGRFFLCRSEVITPAFLFIPQCPEIRFCRDTSPRCPCKNGPRRKPGAKVLNGRILDYFSRARNRKVTAWARLQLSLTPKVSAVLPLVTPVSTAHLMAPSYQAPAVTSEKVLSTSDAGSSR